MNNYTSHWIASGEGIFATDDTAFCVSSSCVGIGGYSDGDDWLVRSTPLLLIPNLERITSFVVQFDVTIFDIESSNACQVKYKYDIDADYRTIASFSSASSKHIKLVNETGSILVEQNKLNDSQVLLIKLEALADGDSSSGGDLCFFDNVYLFGEALDSAIIWSDTMDTDPMTNGWIPSNNESVVFTSTSAYCSSTSCVEISGYSELENSMYHIVPDVDRCFDLFIQFDVALVDMESENACQVMYRYDTDEDDEFFSLSSIGGGNGDQLKMQNMASIPINPQHANATNLYVRLKNNGDSSSGNVTAPTTTTAAEGDDETESASIDITLTLTASQVAIISGVLLISFCICFAGLLCCWSCPVGQQRNLIPPRTQNQVRRALNMKHEKHMILDGNKSTSKRVKTWRC